MSEPAAGASLAGCHWLWTPPEAQPEHDEELALVAAETSRHRTMVSLSLLVTCQCLPSRFSESLLVLVVDDVVINTPRKFWSNWGRLTMLLLSNKVVAKEGPTTLTSSGSSRGSRKDLW